MIWTKSLTSLFSILNKITIKFSFYWGDWVLECSLSFPFLSTWIWQFSNFQVLKSAIVGGNFSAAFHCILCFACGYSFFLSCAIFPIFFVNDCRELICLLVGGISSHIYWWCMLICEVLSSKYYVKYEALKL